MGNPNIVPGFCYSNVINTTILVKTREPKDEQLGWVVNNKLYKLHGTVKSPKLNNKVLLIEATALHNMGAYLGFENKREGKISKLREE